MKKIDKSKILSKEYFKWMEELKEEKKYSSSHKYIKDIKMNLLHCQNGLCAYTEEQLCDIELIDSKHWNEGIYTTKLDSQNLINGDIEHFDCTLKEKQGYLWDNLFMVNSNINCRVKGVKSINPLLKPDSEDYDEFKYLQFDDIANRFKPNKNLSEKEKKDVLDMIETLGINSNAFKRAKQIKSLKEDIAFDPDLLNADLEEPHEYITSWKMTLENLKNNS